MRKERKGKERKGKERKGKERKGKEKGKEREGNKLLSFFPQVVEISSISDLVPVAPFEHDGLGKSFFVHEWFTEFEKR